MRRVGFLALLLLSSCDANSGTSQSPTLASAFPKADRPVAAIVSSRWSTEEDRDNANEAREVMNFSGIAKGMSVADIGGYSLLTGRN